MSGVDGTHLSVGDKSISLKGFALHVASGADGSLNQVLFTAANWLFYFAAIEAVFAIKRRFSSQANVQKQADS